MAKPKFLPALCAVLLASSAAAFDLFEESGTVFESGFEPPESAHSIMWELTGTIIGAEAFGDNTLPVEIPPGTPFRVRYTFNPSTPKSPLGPYLSRYVQDFASGYVIQGFVGTHEFASTANYSIKVGDYDAVSEDAYRVEAICATSVFFPEETIQHVGVFADFIDETANLFDSTDLPLVPFNVDSIPEYSRLFQIEKVERNCGGNAQWLILGQIESVSLVRIEY